MNFLYAFPLVGLGYLVFASSCNTEEKKLIPFFDSLRQSINDEQLIDKFRKAPLDSIEMYSNLFYENLQRVSSNPIYSPIIKSYLEKGVYIENPILRMRIILLAFQKHLNNQPIKKSEIIIQLEETMERIDRAFIKEQNEFDDFLQRSNENIRKGDTVDLILPVRYNVDGNKYIYYFVDYPYDIDFSIADDELKIRAILMKKFFKRLGMDEVSGDIDSTGVVLNFKIIGLNDKTVRMDSLGRKLEVGKKINLSLGNYGRSLNNE